LFSTDVVVEGNDVLLEYAFEGISSPSSSKRRWARLWGELKDT
jgi:hypothetical protein